MFEPEFTERKSRALMMPADFGYVTKGESVCFYFSNTLRILVRWTYVASLLVQQRVKLFWKLRLRGYLLLCFNNLCGGKDKSFNVFVHLYKAHTS